MDRISAHMHMQGLRLCWIYIQARHNSERRDWLSHLNKVVDEGRGLGGLGGVRSMAEVWMVATGPRQWGSGEREFRSTAPM